MTPADILEVSVHVKARSETVIAYLTDPARYVQWTGTRATLDAHPGGLYQVWMREGVQAAGQFVDIDPPHRVVFTWGSIGDHGVDAGSTRIELTLTEDESGTRVLLRHFGLPHPKQVTMHQQGWRMYLHRLTAVIAGDDPGPDPNATP
jgi:uncharacterized protein YndB with AHSA1/START domain